ncbi:MAG: tRNA (adenosine(37)-N6)-threonylcarbamoyltransferase complex dimerization subunit type 1 TsaB [Acidimicrobiaceae bacterium]|nr:tRNA (adenosine(37)-N6)-threonylcarbamoyltransferase complex dimerization subunit type 1 TsaB [Acidimicrobiia bacterium]MCY4492552.1 tRNA (adenosine(37)-N6)-threonylcarbamoyltransferase complex dimerization subunit type 1 TsaB [Acidimicrobiaceae bacterium]
MAPPMILGIESATSRVGCALGDAAGVLAARESAQPRRHAESLAPQIAEILNECGLRASAIEVIAVDVGPGLYTGLRVGITTAITMAHALDAVMVPVTSLELVARRAADAHADAGAADERAADAGAADTRAADERAADAGAADAGAADERAADERAADAGAADTRAAGRAWERIDAVVDARRGELFHAAFTPAGGWLSEPAVVDPRVLAETLCRTAARTLLVGDGAGVYREVFARAGFDAEQRVVHPSAETLVELAAAAVAAGEVVNADSVRPMYLRGPDAQPIATAVPRGREG